MTVGENIYLKYLILVDKDIHKMKSLSHFTYHRTLLQAMKLSPRSVLWQVLTVIPQDCVSSKCLFVQACKVVK